MKLKLLTILFIFILTLISVNATGEGDSFLNIFIFNISDSNATSAVFQTIAIHEINLTRTLNISVIATINVERLGGGTDIAEWQILIDNEIVARTLRTLTANSFASVSMIGGMQGVSSGTHNITIQHRRDGVTDIASRNIEFFLNPHLVASTQTPFVSLSVNKSFTLSTGDWEKVIATNITITGAGSLPVIMHTNALSGAGDEVQFIMQNDEKNSSLIRRTLPAGQIADIAFIWDFENRTDNFHNITLWGISTGSVTLENTAISSISFNSSGNLVQHADITKTTLLTASTDFTDIGSVNFTLNVSDDLYIFAAITGQRQGGGVAKIFDYFVEIDGIIEEENSSINSRTFTSNNDWGNMVISFVHDNENEAEHNVTIWARIDSGNFLVDNLSMILVKVRPLEFQDVITPADISPPIITLISPDNNTATNIIPLNITFSVIDDSGNDIICRLENSSTLFDSITTLQGTNANLTLAEGEISLDQKFPNLNLTCFDNSPANNSASLNLNYTLDTVLPIIFTISPADNLRFNRDIINLIDIKANCTDAPVFRFNITIENSTDRIASFESRSSVNNFIVIDETLNIANIGDGIYSINHTCTDPHTNGEIPDYNVRKNISDTTIEYVTDIGNEFVIKYLQNSLELNTFGSSKTENNDRYKFWFYTNVTETQTERTFIFEIIGKKEVYYIEDSKYKAHFITGNNWIDFEFDDTDAEYIITKNGNGNYEIEITTSRTKLEFDSIGDLNVATITTEFEIFFTQQIKDDTYSLVNCPLENLQRTILFMFFIILSFGIMTIGFNWRNGLIGTLGAFLLLILSAFTYACIIAVGILLTGLSIIFISFFVIKGTRNFI